MIHASSQSMMIGIAVTFDVRHSAARRNALFRNATASTIISGIHPAAAKLPEMPHKNMECILIVEDDPDLSRVLTRSFRLRNFEAESAADIASALLAANKTPPDYAIIDLRLGATSGMALIKPLKAINPATRILVLSGYASIATAVDSIKRGADHFMAKPAYIEEIMSALGIDRPTAPDAPHTPEPNGKRSLEELEWKQIIAMLRAHDGNLSAAARALGMYRRTLQRKLVGRSKISGRDILDEIRNMAPINRRRLLRNTPGK